jgi:hypothetical protein
MPALTAEDWFDRYQTTFADFDAGRCAGQEFFDRRVKACWGLISCQEEAVPFALEMLRSPTADMREDAGGILTYVGRDEAAVDAVVASLAAETDVQTTDSLIGALGKMGSERAIPTLASFIRDPDADGDTRTSAIDALGQIARKRCRRRSEPADAAIRWLDEHGH